MMHASIRCSVAAGLIAIAGLATVARAQSGSGLTYQGQLRENGAPKTGLFDMRFTLFDAPTGGSPVAPTVGVSGVAVSGGVFSTLVDFGSTATPGGPSIFAGGARFVQVEVSPAGANAFTALSPRQAIGSVPSALAVGPLAAISTSGAVANIDIPSGGGTFLHAGSVIEQTFTPAADGWLNASGHPSGTGYIGLLHLVPGSTESVTFELLDDQGNVIATNAGASFGFPEPFGVIYPSLNWTTPVRLVAGRTYRFRMDLPPSVTTIVVGDLYNGGSMFVDGVEVPDRDVGMRLGISQIGQQLRTDAPLGIGTNPSAPLHVIGNTLVEGNLGVGTIQPGARLDVQGNSVLNGNVRIATGEADARLNIGGDGTLAALTGGGTALLRLRAATAAQSPRDAYLGFDSNQTAVLTLANRFGVGDINIRPAIGGRVGIGPGVGAVPNSGLEVANDIYTSTALIRGTGVSGAWMHLAGTTRQYALMSMGSIGTQIAEGSFAIRDVTGSATRLTISPTGKVAIGSEPPSATAHFNVNANGPTELTVGANNTFSGNGTVLVLRTSAQQNGTCQIQGVSRAGFEYGTLVLNPDGGSVAKPGGGSFANYSDRTLKQDIEPLHGTLDRLLALRGYTFRYTDEAVRRKPVLQGTQIGLMAQDVQRIFPDWVDTDGEGKLMVTERATTALLVEALRDLRSEKDVQIKQRDERLATLEREAAARSAELTELRARLDRLEAAARRQQ